MQTNATTTGTPSRLLKIAAVRERTTLGRTTIYQLVKSGQFPAPVSLGARAVAWRESEVEQWIADRTRSTGGAAC